jgi:hypothetical protein
VFEQHVGVAARGGLPGAERFADSVGSARTASTRIRARAGATRVDIDAYAFQIPLGALLPVRVDNLLPACKNIGTTRITNGAYREHATEWCCVTSNELWNDRTCCWHGHPSAP